MRQHRYDFLKQQLIASGFSHTYVDQLVDELWDHYQSIVEELILSGVDEKIAQQSALDQLGKEERILAEVMSRKELMPFPNKRPIFTFIILPILFIFLNFLIFLVIPISILDILIPDMQIEEITNSGFIQVLQTLIFFISYLIPPFAMIVFIYFANRFAVSLKWLAAAASIIAMIGSTLVFTFYYPGSSNFEALIQSGHAIDNEGGLILNGGFWSEFGTNYISFVIPLILFLAYAWLRLSKAGRLSLH